MDLLVKSNEPVNHEYRQLILAAPADLLDRCRAGQFFHLLCPQTADHRPFLRRPMSIYGFYPQSGELHFLFKVTGTGTRALATLQPGDRLSVAGPLGKPFEIEDSWQHLVLVARGVGLATLAPLALEAHRLDRKLTAICSARHRDYLLSIDYFKDLGADVIAITDAEGTSDVDHLERLLEDLVQQGKADVFYTCGSNRILTLLKKIGKRHSIPGQIALEQQMACGLGMCHCCVRPFEQNGQIVNLRVCREGPVFDLQAALAW
ncbi:dihydroorotate dehydrogenase electron transfer subunit [Roseibium marinum]|uniref:dihydroorotate dehydrogenase electron transfer subunit n=1 Tax=Roseibium marinum TaxID=281252 RepID=UPI001F17D277|nr:dihydroorotate dehydrogenase electron transfer subunit [Roseibium marinum]